MRWAPVRALERRLRTQLDRFRRGGAAAVVWALRLTGAAVASYLVALALFPSTEPLLAPLTALLVVQVTPVSLLASGFERVVSVVSGVLLALAFSAVVPLTWWSLGLLILASILVGQVLALQSNLIEVAISAMLVLGVGSLGATSAGGQRITETLVGAVVGVALNLLLPPKVATDDAASAIRDLSERLTVLLDRAALEVSSWDRRSGDVVGRTAAWLDESRRITYGIPDVGAALIRAEQGRQLNVRALRTPNAGPGLRQGLEALEHSAVAVRVLFRSVRDAASDLSWPGEEIGDVVVENLAQTLRELSGAVGAFGDLVRAEALVGRENAGPELEQVVRALDGLNEARARLSDLLSLDTGPVTAELHGALVTAVKRVAAEMDLEERVRRQARLRPTRETRLAPATLAGRRH